MKKFKILLLALLLIPLSGILVACGGKNNSLKEIQNIEFVDRTFTFDNSEKEILVSGEIPEGVTVIYENNTATAVGEYHAKATLSGEGYKTLVLTATLSIVEPEIPNKNIEGITFSDQTYTFDNSEKVLAISGDLPTGVSVSYSMNKATDAGIYHAKAILSGKGYNTLTLTATLTINKADITGIELKDKTYIFNNLERVLTITGTLPDGVTVQYENNTATEIGNYKVIAILSGKNYNTLKLEATMKIVKNLENIANIVISNLFTLPDAWSYFPNTFALPNKILNNELNFTKTEGISVPPVNVTDIPLNGIGKQLNVVYSVLMNTDKALTYLEQFYKYSGTIVSLYQTFINNNPDNYAMFEKTTENFSFKILLNDNINQILAKYKGCNIELAYDKINSNCIGRVEIPGSNIIKYEFNDNTIKLACSIIGISQNQLILNKNEQGVDGTLYEFAGTSDKNIKTTAYISIDNDYTSIVSNKRESDDLHIEAITEIYSNTTGNLVGIHSKETVKKNEYSTFWFNLKDINGIKNIQKENTKNGVNLHTFYINNASVPFQTKKVGGVGFNILSRRYDIEMKEVYFYNYDISNDNYDKIKTEIPMMFIQEEFLNDFQKDINNSNNIENGNSANIFLSIMGNADYTYLISKYSTINSKYIELKDQVTFIDIKEYVGIKNSYFN